MQPQNGGRRRCVHYNRLKPCYRRYEATSATQDQAAGQPVPLPQEQAAEELPTPPPEPRIEDAVRTPETAAPVNDSGNYNMEYDDVPDMDNDDVSATATSDAPTTPR